MNGRQFIASVRKYGRSRRLQVRFVASKGRGSHGTLYLGNRSTVIKDRKKDLGKGLLAAMLTDLEMGKDEI